MKQLLLFPECKASPRPRVVLVKKEEGRMMLIGSKGTILPPPYHMQKEWLYVLFDGYPDYPFWVHEKNVKHI